MSDSPSTTFAQLGVPERICRALEAGGITEPFAIQAATVTDALAGLEFASRKLPLTGVVLLRRAFTDQKAPLRIYRDPNRNNKRSLRFGSRH